MPPFKHNNGVILVTLIEKWHREQHKREKYSSRIKSKELTLLIWPVTTVANPHAPVLVRFGEFWLLVLFIVKSVWVAYSFAPKKKKVNKGFGGIKGLKEGQRSKVEGSSCQGNMLC